MTIALNLDTAVVLASLEAGNEEAAAGAIASAIIDIIEKGATANDLISLAKELDPACVTNCGTILATGAEKEVNCKRSLDQQAGRTAPAKEGRQPAVRSTGTTAAKPRTPKGNKVILKANKEVRAQLTAHAQKLGGTRLQPREFASYTEFLNGFDRPEAGLVLKLTFSAVKGNAKIEGVVVVLEVNSDGSTNIYSGKEA